MHLNLTLWLLAAPAPAGETAKTPSRGELRVGGAPLASVASALPPTFPPSPPGEPSGRWLQALLEVSGMELERGSSLLSRRGL